jgi:hypothetical protein
MIGWSSRNSRYREHRARWWASLTEDQKALERRRSAEEDRWFFGTLFCQWAALFLLSLLVPEGAWNDSVILKMSPLVAVPMILVISAFIANHKKKQVE